MKTCTSASTFLETLARDAHKTEQFFHDVVGNKKCSFIPCVNPTKHVISVDKTDLYKYAVLNSTTLYKICKKASKRLQDRCPMEWLKRMQNERSLTFMNGMLKKQLELATSNANGMDCPICLDDNIATTLILHCGHMVCCTCVKHMLGVSNTRGTLHNVIAHGLHEVKKGASCPLCRDPKAFIHYKLHHFPK
jgi:hypothetical protein